MHNASESVRTVFQLQLAVFEKNSANQVPYFWRMPPKWRLKLHELQIETALSRIGRYAEGKAVDVDGFNCSAIGRMFGKSRTYFKVSMQSIKG